MDRKEDLTLWSLGLFLWLAAAAVAELRSPVRILRHRHGCVGEHQLPLGRLKSRIGDFFSERLDVVMAKWGEIA